MPRSAKRSSVDVPRPEVIVDFNCSQGLLFISMKNIGARSAYNVCTSFDRPLQGLGGQKCISDLQLFRCVEFIPPGKEFSQFVDPIAAWFQKGHPSRYAITIHYDDREGNTFEDRITHNLEIYKDLGTISYPGGSHG
jgi:hypothetical protein